MTPDAAPGAAMAGLEGLEPHYDLVIVGAGLSGAVFAEQAAARLGWTSLIIDKRDHIGACSWRQRSAGDASLCEHSGGAAARAVRCGAAWRVSTAATRQPCGASPAQRA